VSLNSDAGHRVRLKASRWWHLDSAGTLGALDALYSGAVQLENRTEISRGLGAEGLCRLDFDVCHRQADCRLKARMR
jgi:hypothetical protein